MEFHEKLRELRRQRGLTQQQLAERLYVSRTAVSKWESGRGCPGLDSLRELSAYFAVSLDDLLLNENPLPAPQTDCPQKTDALQNLAFGLLDCSAAAFLCLPLFGQRSGGAVRAVSLFSLTGAVKIPCLVIVVVTAVFGLLTLAFQNEVLFRSVDRRRVSLFLSAAAVALLIISPQPYAAALAFALLAVKALMLM